MRWHAFLLSLIAVLVIPGAAAETRPVIEWRDQRLSVIATNAPLVDVLRAVARQTDLEMKGIEHVQGLVSPHLLRVSLYVGLQHLLASTDHLMLVRMAPSGEVCPSLVLILERKSPAALAMTGSNVETPSLAALKPQEHDPNQRLVALQQLDALPAAQRNALVSAALQEADPSVRQVAYRFLYEQGEKDSLAELLKHEALSTDIARRQTAIETLGQLFAGEATELLLQATTDEHPDVRYAAFAQLSHLDLPEAEQALRTQLTHPAPEIRLLAIEAMAARGARTAREAALTAMADSDELVRGKGANLLRELEISEGGGQ